MMKKNLSMGMAYKSLLLIPVLMFISPIMVPGQLLQQSQIPEITTPKIEKMVDTGDRKLHCSIYGQGAPAVVLISGFRALQNYWNPIIPTLSDQTTMITYDRAGYGKSEPGTLPCDGITAMQDLKILLEQLGVPGPYLIVGHSLGGRLARIFASRYPQLTAGLILIDTGLQDPRHWGREGPREMPNHPNAKSEAECNDLIWWQAEQLVHYPQVPYTVLTAGKTQAYPGSSPADQIKMIKYREADQKKLAQIIPGGKHILVPESGHHIIYDDTEIVIQSITEMVERLRPKPQQQ